MLHITNGDSPKQSIEQTGLPGEVLAWKDVLHEGPAPAGLSLEQMSQVRARYIADYYHEPYEEVVRDFVQRDATLTEFRNHEEVVLWFEHDLYDQLQLVQILDWFAQQDIGTTKLSLICINAFPGINDFMGLGQLTPVQLASLFDGRKAVTQIILQLGQQTWRNFCSPTPTALESVMQGETAPLPFLKEALARHLEEFPDVGNGLSRTERQIVELVVSGVHKPAELFRAALRKEENAFMGDMTFWIYISNLCDGFRPLLKCADGNLFSLPAKGIYESAFREQILVATDDGRATLSGQADWIMLRGGIDRWLGGVHLQGHDAEWRWNSQRGALVGHVTGQ